MEQFTFSKACFDLYQFKVFKYRIDCQSENRIRQIIWTNETSLLILQTSGTGGDMISFVDITLDMVELDIIPEVIHTGDRFIRLLSGSDGRVFVENFIGVVFEGKK
ncbi:hypothetical protein HK096_000460 [Nowakowskiella sp. JEL0078]|nr:hypothetical protein HK096_000460 [Nowakowskiella sp. JEL0078]